MVPDEIQMLSQQSAISLSAEEALAVSDYIAQQLHIWNRHCSAVETLQSEVDNCMPLTHTKAMAISDLRPDIPKIYTPEHPSSLPRTYTIPKMMDTF